MDKYKKVINIIRCLVRREWGADRTALKAIYSGLMRAILDYGCMVYGLAACTTLKTLDCIQSQYKVGKRISDNMSMYTGEMLAIWLAVQWVEEKRHSDSRPDILLEIQQTLYRIQNDGPYKSIFMDTSTYWNQRKLNGR